MTKFGFDQRGVALVSVLLIAAVATALAYAMAVRHSLDVTRSRWLLDSSQARQYALGAEEYARQILFDDWEEPETRAKDSLQEGWAAIFGDLRSDAADADSKDPATAFAIENGTMTLRIEDLRGAFNLNSVAKGANQLRFKRLLDHLGLEPELADAWAAWVGGRPHAAGEGETDRLPAASLAGDVSEFIAATAINREQYALLRPHIATLPLSNLLVNVNTATDAVLVSLGDKFSAADAQWLVNSPRDFRSVREAIVEYAKLGEIADVLSVSSNYFVVRASAQVGDVRVTLTSTIHRAADSGRLAVVSRSYGDAFDWLTTAEEEV